MSHFCFQCARDTEDKPCEILGRSFAYGLYEPGYPKEWIEDDNGPRCTAFVQDGEEIPYRCPHTMDMFDETR